MEECQESNLRLLGEKRECYPCAMQPPWRPLLFFASPCVTLRQTTSNYIKLRWIESSCVKFRSSFPRGICFSFPSDFLVSLRFPGPGLPPGAKFVGQGEACPPSCSSSRRPPSVFRFGSTDSSLERSFSPIRETRRPEKQFFRRLHKLIDYLYLTTYGTKCIESRTP